MIFLQSLRMTRRDWHAGELRFLLISLIVAVSSWSEVGFFIDRMRAGMTRDAHQFLGADLLISADQRITPNWRNEAERQHLTLADTVEFPSMAIAGEGDATFSALSIFESSHTVPAAGIWRLVTSAPPTRSERTRLPRNG